MIYIQDYDIQAASLGPNNPLPDIKNNTYIHAGFETTDRVSAEEATYLGQGMINTMLPYQMQDQYDRDRSTRQFKAAIIENAHLRAVFLPELGGRLWSLYDKDLGRELLYKNPVFQPGNLALRNAWFSGGVEFNVGIKGHNPLTCSPIFCERAETPDGDVLNLYEYERIRGVVFTVSAWLPEDSRVLYLRCRIENTEDKQKPMYWWSNIAVPETPDTRVIVPAEDSFLCSYQEDHYVLDKVSIPYSQGTDISYPTNLKNSQDFFYKIPKEEAKWIASVEKDGIGLLQCSTDRLFGRKTFLWGQNPGGRNWNRFLSDRDFPYIEIQAGLAHTQLEHIPMEGCSEWSWVEAYTAMEGDPALLYSDNWQTAVGEVARHLAQRVGDSHTLTFPSEESVTARTILSNGSGWGALEECLRGERVSRYHTFPRIEGETDRWHTLLAEGSFPAPMGQPAPDSYVTGEAWAQRLAALPEQNWYSLLQLGVVRYAEGDLKGAEAAWQASLEQEENAWAHRNLGALYKNEYGNLETGKAHLLRAVELEQNCRSLYVECGSMLTSCGEDARWLALFDDMSATLQQDGRLRLYRAIALMHLDRVKEAAAILNPQFVMNDIKEGELSVSAVWFDLYRRLYEKQNGVNDPVAADKAYPLPRALDFRMHL